MKEQKDQKEQTQPLVNRKHKDALFRFIFNDKEKLLDLFNAINNSHYTDPDRIEINTLEDVIFITNKNDISFIVANTLNIYEHHPYVKQKLKQKLSHQ